MTMFHLRHRHVAAAGLCAVHNFTKPPPSLAIPWTPHIFLIGFTLFQGCTNETSSIKCCPFFSWLILWHFVMTSFLISGSLGIVKVNSFISWSRKLARAGASAIFKGSYWWKENLNSFPTISKLAKGDKAGVHSLIGFDQEVSFHHISSSVRNQEPSRAIELILGLFKEQYVSCISMYRR